MITMDTRYSDYIRMQDFLPVYDMMDEKPNMWRTFIPTKQFSELLQRSITASLQQKLANAVQCGCVAHSVQVRAMPAA